jgi:hypothetical protein
MRGVFRQRHCDEAAVTKAGGAAKSIGKRRKQPKLMMLNQRTGGFTGAVGPRSKTVTSATEASS